MAIKFRKCTQDLSVQGTGSDSFTYGNLLPTYRPAFFPKLYQSEDSIGPDTVMVWNLISFSPRSRPPLTDQDWRTALFHFSVQGGGGYSGLRLSGGSGGICIHRAVRMEGRECKGISVPECISDWSLASWRNPESYDSVSV